MGKILVVLCCALFVCGIVGHFVPGTQSVIAGNAHGITWMMVIGVCTFVGSWKMVHGK